MDCFTKRTNKYKHGSHYIVLMVKFTPICQLRYLTIIRFSSASQAILGKIGWIDKTCPLGIYDSITTKQWNNEYTVYIWNVEQHV